MAVGSFQTDGRCRQETLLPQTGGIYVHVKKGIHVDARIQGFPAESYEHHSALACIPCVAHTAAVCQINEAHSLLHDGGEKQR